MSVLNQIAAARSDEFAARVAMVTMTLAMTVLVEDPETANHANRIIFAQKHLRAEINNKTLAAAVIASNSTIQTTINGAPLLLGSNVPDGDIEFVITGLLNAFANAYAAA